MFLRNGDIQDLLRRTAAGGVAIHRTGVYRNSNGALVPLEAAALRPNVLPVYRLFLREDENYISLAKARGTRPDFAFEVDGLLAEDGLSWHRLFGRTYSGDRTQDNWLPVPPALYALATWNGSTQQSLLGRQSEVGNFIVAEDGRAWEILAVAQDADGAVWLKLVYAGELTY